MVAGRARSELRRPGHAKQPGWFQRRPVTDEKQLAVAGLCRALFVVLGWLQAAPMFVFLAANHEQYCGNASMERYLGSHTATGDETPRIVLACYCTRGRSGGRFSPDSMRPWKRQYNLCPFHLWAHGLNQGCPFHGKSAAEHSGYVDQGSAPANHTPVVWAVADHVTFSTQHRVLQGNCIEASTHFRNAIRTRILHHRTSKDCLNVFNSNRVELFRPRSGHPHRPRQMTLLSRKTLLFPGGRVDSFTATVASVNLHSPANAVSDVSPLTQELHDPSLPRPSALSENSYASFALALASPALRTCVDLAEP